MKTTPEFRPGSNAETAHRSLKASLEILEAAQHCAGLWFGEIMHRKLYRELGFSTMRAYALERLGFSSTRAGDFMRLAKKLNDLPVLKDELESGRWRLRVAMRGSTGQANAIRQRLLPESGARCCPGTGSSANARGVGIPGICTCIILCRGLEVVEMSRKTW